LVGNNAVANQHTAKHTADFGDLLPHVLAKEFFYKLARNQQKGG
jgi:hypothetical protein